MSEKNEEEVKFCCCVNPNTSYFYKPLLLFLEKECTLKSANPSIPWLDSCPFTSSKSHWTC